MLLASWRGGWVSAFSIRGPCTGRSPGRRRSAGSIWPTPMALAQLVQRDSRRAGRRPRAARWPRRDRSDSQVRDHHGHSICGRQPGRAGPTGRVAARGGRRRTTSSPKAATRAPSCSRRPSARSSSRPTRTNGPGGVIATWSAAAKTCRSTKCLSAQQTRDQRDRNRPVGALVKADDAIEVSTNQRTPKKWSPSSKRSCAPNNDFTMLSCHWLCQCIAGVQTGKLRTCCARSCRRKPLAKPVSPDDDESQLAGSPLVLGVVVPLLGDRGAGFRFRSTGREHVPATGPVLLVSNHQSHLDPVLVGIACPRQMRFLARHSLFFWPLSWLIRSLGAVPIDRERGGLGGIKATLKLLKQAKRCSCFRKARAPRTVACNHCCPASAHWLAAAGRRSCRSRSTARSPPCRAAAVFRARGRSRSTFCLPISRDVYADINDAEFAELTASNCKSMISNARIHRVQ